MIRSSIKIDVDLTPTGLMVIKLARQMSWLPTTLESEKLHRGQNLICFSTEYVEYSLTSVWSWTPYWEPAAAMAEVVRMQGWWVSECRRSSTTYSCTVPDTLTSCMSLSPGVDQLQTDKTRTPIMLYSIDRTGSCTSTCILWLVFYPVISAVAVKVRALETNISRKMEMSIHVVEICKLNFGRKLGR